MRFAMRIMLSVIAVALTAALGAMAELSGVQSAGLDKAPLSAAEVVKNLQRKNRERAQSLRQFESTRVYTMQYRGFPSDRHAQMIVNVSYWSPGRKEFTIISESGSKFIIEHVFKRLLESEQEAANRENQRQTELSEATYTFRMLAYENSPSGPRYVLEVTPKSRNKFLFRGTIWVDANDFAVMQIEGEPAKSPSVWIKKTDIEHKYVKVNNFWLPAENHTESIIRLGGRASLSIEYKDYKVVAAAPVDGIENLDGNSAIAGMLDRVE